MKVLVVLLGVSTVTLLSGMQGGLGRRRDIMGGGAAIRFIVIKEGSERVGEILWGTIYI